MDFLGTYTVEILSALGVVGAAVTAFVAMRRKPAPKAPEAPAPKFAPRATYQGEKKAPEPSPVPAPEEPNAAPVAELRKAEELIELVPPVSQPELEETPVEPAKEKPKRLELYQTPRAPHVEDEVAPVAPVAETKIVPVGLELGLGRTSKSFWDRLGKFFNLSPGHQISEAEWEQIEDALLEADVGMTTTTALTSKVKERLRQDGTQELKMLFTQEGEGLFDGMAHGLPELPAGIKPYVISIVGVNGVGKTTTIGKLAHWFTRGGKKVLVGAGDTFRAAAISQLKTWADRVGCDFVTGREGGDPGAVSFDSLAAAKARNADIVLFDTAGRLHTKTNLMDELKRVHKVMKKVIPEAPHETWLVIDGTLGQNSVQQAREFSKVLDLTGVVVTKLDGTAKGGAVFSIVNELKLPIRFIGLGEKAEDLVPFEAKPFVDAILNPKSIH